MSSALRSAILAAFRLRYAAASLPRSCFPPPQCPLPVILRGQRVAPPLRDLIGFFRGLRPLFGVASFL